VTRRQQSVLGALGALVLAALVTLLVRGGGDDGETVDAGSTTSSPTSSTSTTTTTTTVLVTTTVAAATTLTTSAGGTPPTTRAQPVVTGENAILRRPGTPEVRAAAPNASCHALADPGWTSTCTQYGVGGETLVALTETRELNETDTARRAYVFRETSSGQWQVQLRALDDGGNRFSAIGFRIELIKPPLLQVAFGFRNANNDSLAVDVVDLPGTVVVHRDLARGAARVAQGRLDLWRSLTPGGSTFAHEVVQYVNGAWRIVSSENQPAAQVPASQI
jgi:hypothetical protein